MNILQRAIMTLMALMLVSPIIVQCQSVFSYKGFRVYEVTAATEEDVNFLHSLADNEDFDFFSLQRAVGAKSTVLVRPQRQLWFERSLNTRRIPFVVSIADLESVLDAERQSQLITRRSRNDGDGVTFDRYYRHDEINKYLESLAAASPERIQVRSIGKSYEGRDIKTIKLTAGDGRADKNSIYIDAGIHAREWIAPATALYLIQELAGSQSGFLDDIDVIVQPLVNPDGYEYSHRLERLWRKTRSGILPASCRGTDANRNFDYHWGEVGASSNQCAETYRGERAFSEKETAALRDAVREVKDNCKFYLTLHSYGNYLLYPWGYTSDLPESWREIDEIAQIGANAIANATGTKYTVGSSTNVLYAAAGGSDDYMFGALGVPISITMELPGGGTFGFDMPASKIEETVKESAVGIFAMIEAVAAKYK